MNSDVTADGDTWRSGTHLDCEHGVCGACTVLVDDRAVRSCLLLAVRCAGWFVRTVEGLATDGLPPPMPRAFAREHALRRGFRTPGFLMLAVRTVSDGDERV